MCTPRRKPRLSCIQRYTARSLAALREAGLGAAEPLEVLEDAWRLQQNLTQLIKVALEEGADPSLEPTAFRRLMARAAGESDFRKVRPRLEAARKAARNAYEMLVQP